MESALEYSKYLMEILHRIDAGFALAAVLINGAFILMVLTRTSLTAVYVTFLFNCFATIVWNFGDFMVMATADPFWFYFSLIGTGMIPAVMFHFVNALVEPGKNRIWIGIAYVLCLPLALSAPVALMDARVRAFVDGPLWNVLFILLLFPLFSVSIGLLVRAIRRATSRSEANRLRYILIAACIACFSGLTDLLQIFAAPVPPLGHLGSLIYSSVLAVGVFKHRTAYDLLAAMRTKLDLLNELSAGVAHELKNPLSSIQGAARLLHAKAGDHALGETKQYLSIISEEVERLNGIVNNYGCLVRPTKIEREPILINRVLEKTVMLMRASEGTPRVELNLSPESPLCKADAATLKQIFINLIKNAAEACGPEDTIRIRSELVSPWVRITVHDSGNGVPSEILPHIFEPFVSTKANSMGLGLAICRRLVDLNGGTIEAANTAEGACFTIHLPVADAPLRSS
ncbi:MAG TPA: ATP-binding protein [Acidobacteriota bacterium]|nr:ATP-binding protein [Acidobacteriota bacterium]